MSNRFTQHPERATNTGHALTESDLKALSQFVVGLLDTDGPEETVARVEALDGLLSDLSKGGIPEAMTLGDLLYIASAKAELA